MHESNLHGSIPRPSIMPKRKLHTVANLGSYNRHKGQSSYKKPKQNNKENVSNCDWGWEVRLTALTMTYRSLPYRTHCLLVWGQRSKGPGYMKQSAPHSAGNPPTYLAGCHRLCRGDRHSDRHLTWRSRICLRPTLQKTRPASYPYRSWYF